MTNKSILKFAFIMMALLVSGASYSHDEDIDITSLHIPIRKSMHLLNLKTGKEIRVKPDKDRKIRIVGSRPGAYIVRIIEDGKEKPQKYYIDRYWARRALNIMAAVHAAKIQSVVENVGRPPGGEDCVETNSPTPDVRPQSRPERISSEELIDPDLPRTVTSKNAWKPGCEVLEKGKELKTDDQAKLYQCIRAIQLSITDGARKRTGRLDRSTVFKNIFKRLRPEEQDFALKVFTVQGEVGFLANGGNHQEMMAVMKVMDNRVRNANNDRQNKNGNRPFNAAHVALDPWQFSMYNANEKLWEEVIDPGNSANFSNAIKSFVKYQKADIQPQPQMENVYHYHANYMLPTDSVWGKGFRANHKSWEVDVTIDGNELRREPAGLNESSSSDRNKIARSRSLQRHRFYYALDAKGKLGRNKDGWLRSLNIPWD